MSKPLWFRGKTGYQWKCRYKKIAAVIKTSNILFFVIAFIVLAGVASLLNNEIAPSAKADYFGSSVMINTKSPLLNDKKELFANANNKNGNVFALGKELKRQTQADGRIDSGQFAQKIYEIVGDAPIREMVPFIAKRDEKVAAFLVGIAKKESSFGSRSPIKDGETCYNYWGYKSSGERGTAMGYACFGSAEEAIRVVGDRIEVLVNKQRNTPARMVDTWKCGTSCAGDPGAPSWTSTVALYFNQLVTKEG